LKTPKSEVIDMSDRYYTVPITNNKGTPIGATGRTVTQLAKGDWVDAGMIAPRSGSISVGIICSSEMTNPAVNIWRGYVHGANHMDEMWTNPAKGKHNLAITTPNKFLRFMIIPPGHVNEGDYIGIRIVNLEDGFNLDLATIFIQYQQ
jgi:hypothetical protein